MTSPPAKREAIQFDRYPQRLRYQTVGVFAAAAVVSSFVAPPFVSLGILLAMLLVLVFRDRLTLDIPNRLYRIDQGFFRMTGDLSDIKGFQVERHQLADSMGNQTAPTFSVSVLWTTYHAPWRIAEWETLDQALAFSMDAAHRSGLPVSEEQGVVRHSR